MILSKIFTQKNINIIFDNVLDILESHKILVFIHIKLQNNKFFISILILINE